MDNKEILNNVGYCVNLFINNKDINKFFMIRDKTKTINYLKKRNYPTTKRITNKNALINKHIVAKPNYGECCGNGIMFFKPNEKIPDKYLNNEKYFFEKYETGNHYRIVMYQHEIISIIKRIKPTVTGNGIHTIKELVNITNKKRSNHIIIDKNINTKYVPKKNEVIKCNNMSNFSTGGTLEVVDLKTISNSTKNLFIKLSKEIDLNIFAIDLIASDITRERFDQDSFAINELEYCNGWDIHYLIKDKFYYLSKILLLKVVIFLYIVKKFITVSIMNKQITSKNYIDEIIIFFILIGIFRL